MADANGNWIFRSPVIIPLESQLPPIEGVNQPLKRLTIRADGKPIRVLSTNVSINNGVYRVQIAEQIRGYENAIDGFGLALLIWLPVLLAAASVGGYWMSARALRPVARITGAALEITARNLSSRLDVPPADDELRRLSQTLNSMLERLEGAFNRITQFTADASHELRTPLAFMLSTAEISLRRSRSEVEYREALSNIAREIETTTTLVDNLLFFARTDDGSETLRKCRTDLAEIALDASRQGRAMAERKNVEFRQQIQDCPMWIQGDSSRLKRLFLVLIDNSIKYTPPGGIVSASLGVQDGAALFKIEDTGIGIRDSDLPHIFERFYRAEKARTRETGGTGLGLSIGRQIAHLHGGTVEAASALGRGSVFLVRLPLESG
jgi:heavy metal sensor kinase